MVAYGSDDGFRTYHTARGRDVSAYQDDAIEAARLVSSEWLDSRYRSAFPGLKVGQRDQVREWPRQGAYDVYRYIIDYTTVPAEIENATYEVALIQLTSPGSLSISFTPNKYKSARVEGAVDVEYMQYASASDVQTQYALIDEILSNILTGDGNMSPLSGRVCRV